MQHAFRNHAAQDAALGRHGHVVSRTHRAVPASIDDGGFCCLQPHLVGHAAGAEAKGSGSETSAKGRDRVLLLVIALVLLHLLASGHRTFTDTTG
ncbi:hypothetical protein [Acidovorax sp.]|uniref:hypothetical protein n=1 Tax=Acidovorax sp. TaxID=1872122 RepID=UPI0031D2BCF7